MNGAVSILRRAALCALLFLACQFSPLASLAQGSLYERYSQHDGVMVASVKGFPLDSVSRIDVLVVEATDNDGWDWMKQEFLIAELPPEQQSTLHEGSDVVFFARRSRTNPREGVPVKGDSIDVSEGCYMGISYLQRSVYIFCADSEEQSDAIVSLLVRKIMHSNRK